jgi:predicted ribosome quality control (RQC) complex YloA/Tae2 family protein
MGNGTGGQLATGNKNIDIDNAPVGDESNTIRIGGDNGAGYGSQTRTFIVGISGTAVGGVQVMVDANGQLGVVGSSQRFKDEIKSMDTASEAILALRPVTFRYKHEIDPNGIPQFGLVAEEVEKVNRDLVARDAQGKVYTVRYEAVNAMLLNEFLKEHRTVEELKATVGKQEATIGKQEATISQLKAAALKQEIVNAELKAAALKQEAVNAEQRKGLEALTASLKKQESQIQKVSAQLEMSKPAPRTVDNNQ